MRMIRRATIDGIDLVLLRPQQLAEIAVSPRLRKKVVRFFGMNIVHITERDDFKAGLRSVLEMRMPDTANTDCAYGYFF